MLILSRRIGETLVIEFNGKRVDVIPMSVNGCQVRLGIKAPKEVKVDREEVYLKKKSERLTNHTKVK